MDPGAELGGVGEEGSSGQTHCQKFRFAFSLFGPFAAITCAVFARDFYVLELGADATLMGLIFTVFSFVLPLFDALNGYAQDRGLIQRCFPKESWGRRAPWFFLNLTTTTIFSFLLYLPPLDYDQGAESADVTCQNGTVISESSVEQDKKSETVMFLWFSSCVFGSYYSLSSCFIAWESARAELYPYKEERVVVEGYAKASVLFGIAFSAPAALWVLANTSLLWRFIVSLYFAFLIFLSMTGVNIMRHAQQPSTYQVKNMCRETLEVLKQSAFQHLLLVRFLQGAHDAISAGFLLSYLTYVIPLSGIERSFMLTLVGLLGGFVELVMSWVWSNVFNRRDGCFDMQKTAAMGRLMAVPLGPVFIMSLEPKVLHFIFYFASQRFFFSPFTFWRIAATSWVVDEDTHREEGHRRESVFFGTQNMLQNFGRNIISSLSFMGMGLVGLRTVNCSLSCDKETCEEERYEMQSETVRFYVRSMYGIVCPLLELLCCISALTFPIKGERLALLYANQAEHFKVPTTNSPNGNAKATPNKGQQMGADNTESMGSVHQSSLESSAKESPEPEKESSAGPAVRHCGTVRHRDTDLDIVSCDIVPQSGEFPPVTHLDNESSSNSPSTWDIAEEDKIPRTSMFLAQSRRPSASRAHQH